MASVDRNVLRIATYELLYLDEISPNITINEAIEIARGYSTEESSRFINGILDKVKKSAQERKISKVEIQKTSQDAGGNEESQEAENK